MKYFAFHLHTKRLKFSRHCESIVEAEQIVGRLVGNASNRGPSNRLFRSRKLLSGITEHDSDYSTPPLRATLKRLTLSNRWNISYHHNS